MREAIAGRFVGARVKRVEDPRLLTGAGCYVDDIVVPDMLHAAFARSPHPHALIQSIDADAARRLPGVVGVFTGADIAKLTNPFVGLLPLPSLYNPVHYALATDRVRLVGDPVAMVVATSRCVAEDAAELVAVDYEPLEAIATIDQALDSRRPSIWPGARGNVMFRATDEYGDLDHAFRTADRVITERFVQHRHANQPMETRGCVAEIDRATNALVYHTGTQNPQMVKWSLGLLTKRQTTWHSLVDLVGQRERLQRLAKTAIAYGREMRAQAASKPAPPLPPLMVPQPTSRTALGGAVRARAEPHGSHDPVVRRSPCEGSSDLAARHRARHRGRVRRQDDGESRRRRCGRRGHRHGSLDQVDRGPQRAPRCRRASARRADGRRRRVHRRRHLARVARTLGYGSGRVPRLPDRCGDVYADHQDDDARSVPLPRVPLRRNGHRLEQGDIRRVPRSVGSRNLGA